MLLESSPDTSVPICPGVPLVLTCIGTELGSLSWYRDDGTSFFTINNFGGITGSMLNTPPDGLQVVVNSFQPTGPTSANFTSTLTVDNATLVSGSEICCGVRPQIEDCRNVTLKSKLGWIYSCIHNYIIILSV